MVVTRASFQPVVKHGALVPVSQELLDDAMSTEDMLRQADEQQRAFNALPAKERKRILAERKRAYEAQRCKECGCHPDEHGAD